MPSIFKTVFKLSTEQSLLYGLILILAGVVSVAICALTIDIVGRKLWIAGSMFLGSARFIILWLIGTNTVMEVLIWASIGYAWMAIVTMSVYLYTPEVYPTRMRAFGTSLASAWLRLSSIIGPSYVGYILGHSSIGYVFLGFGIVSFIGALIFGFFGIETKGKSLEELSS